jgi:uncharacterized pyridoxamine 5'-phosphate oxidase family protein
MSGRITIAGLFPGDSPEEVAERAFALLKQIRTVAVATMNGDRPAVRFVHVSAIRDGKLYFLTARGKPMYHQIRNNSTIAISGMTSDHIMVRVEGTVTFMEDRTFLERLITNKEGMYAGKTEILEMFFMADGTGEIFDLSSDLPGRMPFAFGNARIKERGYLITDSCIACGTCKDACTCNAISKGEIYRIHPIKCLHCGRCFEKCPERAIIPINITVGS